MEIKDYTDLTYRERTLLAEYRLSDANDREKILAQVKALNAQKTSEESANESDGNL